MCQDLLTGLYNFVIPITFFLGRKLHKMYRCNYLWHDKKLFNPMKNGKRKPARVFNKKLFNLVGE